MTKLHIMYSSILLKLIFQYYLFLNIILFILLGCNINNSQCSPFSHIALISNYLLSLYYLFMYPTVLILSLYIMYPAKFIELLYLIIFHGMLYDFTILNISNVHPCHTYIILNNILQVICHD